MATLVINDMFPYDKLELANEIISRVAAEQGYKFVPAEEALKAIEWLESGYDKPPYELNPFAKLLLLLRGSIDIGKIELNLKGGAVFLIRQKDGKVLRLHVCGHHLCKILGCTDLNEAASLLGDIFNA